MKSLLRTALYAVLQVALIALFQSFSLGISLAVGVILGLSAMKCAGSENSGKHIGPLIALWIILPNCVGAFLVYRHGGFDIAWFSQAVWNVAHSGVPLVYVAEPLHHMANHCEPIVYLLGWAYALLGLMLPTYFFLFAAQATCNLGVAWASLRYFKQERSDAKEPFLLAMSLVVMHWGFAAANQFEFHPPTLGLSIFLLSFALQRLGRKKTAIALAILSACCGEMFVIIGICSAVYYLVEDEASLLRSGWIFAGGFLTSALLLLSYFKYWKFYFSRGNYTDFAAERYSQVGGSVVSIILFPFLHPWDFLQLVLAPEKSWYLLKFFLPLLLLLPFIKFRHWRRAIRPAVAGLVLLMAPLAKILLSNYSSFLRYDVHYAADILPGLFFLIYALLRTREWEQPQPGGNPNQIFLIVVSALMISFGPWKIDSLKESPYFQKGLISGELRRYLREIPPTQSVYSDNAALSAELADRRVYFADVADRHLEKDNLPDLILLAWPPEHFNAGTPDPDSFRRSLKVENPETLTSSYRNGRKVYEKIRVFPIANWGELSVWRRKDDI